MVYNYLTKKNGLSSDPETKTVPFKLSPQRLFSGERTLLSRALCSFDSRPLPQNLTGSKLKRSIELAARSSAPYEDPGIFISLGDQRASIWTYDQDHIREISGVSVRQICPESALHAPQDGAVLIKVLEGYEGQFWVEGELVASRWWPSAVSEADWNRFCLAAERFGCTATPRPEPRLPAKGERTPSNEVQLGTQLKWLDIRTWVTLLGMVFMLVIFYTGARLVWLDHNHAKMQNQYEVLWVEKAAARENARELRAAQSRVAALSNLYNVPHPIPALAEPLVAALEDGGTIESIYYDQNIFELKFTRTTAFSQRDFVADLESNPNLSRVSLVQGQRTNEWELTFEHGLEGQS